MDIIDILCIWCILLVLIMLGAYAWGTGGGTLAKKHGLKVCWMVCSLLVVSLTVYAIIATKSTPIQ